MDVDRRDPELRTAVAAEDALDLAVPVAHSPEPSFEEFYRREYLRTCALARVLAGGPSSDDIAQEAMLVAYRRWPEVSRLTEPAMWVRRVCANLATSQLRRRGIEARAMVRLSARPQSPAMLSDEDEKFWEAVRSLPRRQAQVVALFYLYDLAVTDIATTLEMSEGSVKTHLSRARAALAERLTAAGGDEA
jgi:RNA polymerase sigma-70 factor (ECF subfamily)